MHVLFENREEAGRRIAKKLTHYRHTDTVILTIPRGGIPVAIAVAHRLQLDWGVIVAGKLPIPSFPEAGFGAVTADGSVVLNEAMVHGLQLTSAQIEEVAARIREEIERRSELYLSARHPISLANKSVILIDDGLASGYTMLAAIKSARAQSPLKIIAAAPVASRAAAKLIEEAADECVFEIVSPSVPFAVADFYVVWHDLTDDDILPMLRETDYAR